MALITAFIVDDEQHNIENLTAMLQQHCKHIAIVGNAENVVDAANAIKQLNPDVVFLDIQIGQYTGFDLLKNLDNREFEVVFVTAYDQYGIQAVKFAALDYLLKPIDVEELKASVDKVVQKISLKKNNVQLDFLLDYLKHKDKKSVKIALPLYNEIRYIEVDTIVRCESNNSYTNFHLTNGEKILVSKPLKEYDELLCPRGFLRCHQSHLVNAQFIKSYLKEDGGNLLMLNGHRIPISKLKKEAVKLALNQ